MERIVVDFGSLSSLEDVMDRTIDSIERLLSELRVKLHTALASWEGGAFEAYQAYQTQWDDAAADLQDVLSQLRHVVHTARGNHSAALRANLSMWRRG